jgi:hypothetical protein
MAPVYVLVMALMIAGIEGTRRLLSVPFGRKRMVDFAGLFLCALWLHYPFRALYDNTAHRMKDGAGGYATSAWENSPLMQWLRNHPLPGKIYSNGSDAIYLLTRAVTGQTPQARYEHGPAAFARELASQASYIVWFHDLHRPWLYDLRELLSCCRVQEVATFPDGGVYRYVGEGGPGVSAVYRFWSPRLGRHFYTIQKAERNRLFTEYDGTWEYEGPAFHVPAPDSVKPPDVHPVYRFWSAGLRTHFYTMDEAEKDRLLLQPAGAWTCEGPAFFAWSQASEPDLMPVYRFWSARLGCHFYTISETERAKLVGELSDTWTDEGVVWYAYGPLPCPASDGNRGHGATLSISDAAQGVRNDE